MGLNNGSRVAAGGPKIGGGLYFSRDGSAPAPTDATTALDAAFRAAGPISQEGVTPNRETNTEDAKEWDGTDLASLLSDESRGFTCVLYGIFDADMNDLLFEDSVTVTAADETHGTQFALEDKGGKPNDAKLVFELAYKGKARRLYVPVADLTITGEQQWQKSALTGYELTIKALKDENGVRVYEYLEDDDIVPAP